MFKDFVLVKLQVKNRIKTIKKEYTYMHTYSTYIQKYAIYK